MNSNIKILSLGLFLLLVFSIGNYEGSSASPIDYSSQKNIHILANKDICLDGCPIGAPSSDKIIQRPIYISANNGQTKFSDWVAYIVSLQTIGPTKHRIWHLDPDLPSDETLAPSDYRDAHKVLHVDRGHQAPLASLTGTPYWDMADDLSNITPQETDLNEGAWEKLESAERKLAREENISVHSVTGPLYERVMPKLPHAHLKHTIPSGYWKVVAVMKGNELRVGAFIMDQTLDRETDFYTQAVSLATVEARAHL